MAHKSHKKPITAVDGSQTFGVRSTSSGQPMDIKLRIKERAYEMYCARRWRGWTGRSRLVASRKRNQVLLELRRITPVNPAKSNPKAAE